MNKFTITLLSCCAAVTALLTVSQAARADERNLPVQIHIYDNVIFFDGYNTLENLSEESKAMIPEDDGILRHSTSLYSVPLTEEQLSMIGEHLTMKIEVGALCDNYDRIGNINMALVPKGAETYNKREVERLELGRFITPFMNKNRQPDRCPYEFDIDNVSLILRDSRLRDSYDIWIEFELFGIPYAANEQVAGCAGRQDVFTGTLWFETDEQPAPLTDQNVLVPIKMKVPEHEGTNFNNYDPNSTDEVGKTVKTYTFEIPEDVVDSEIVLITSNHGANDGGEEYNRRKHAVHFDGSVVLIYTPGRDSCEPFRVYNTQPNGIYGYNVRSDAEWQSFSNWCPGDKIDNRIINLGALPAGEHFVRLYVAGAKFVGKQGDIPVSIYFQGLKEGDMPTPLGVRTPAADFRSRISIDGNTCHVASDRDILNISLYDAEGRLMDMEYRTSSISLASCRGGVYIVVVEYADGLLEHHKIMR